MQTAADPRLESLDVLVGTWDTEATHGMFPDLVVRGHATFEWLEGGWFLIQRAVTDHPKFPDSMWVIGLPSEELGVEARDELLIQYYDSRGVHRILHSHFRDGEWAWFRDHPGFDQRYVGTLDAGGDVLESHGQLRQDDGVWNDDLSITFRRRA